MPFAKQEIGPLREAVSGPRNRRQSHWRNGESTDYIGCNSDMLMSRGDRPSDVQVLKEHLKLKVVCGSDGMGAASETIYRV